MGSHRIGRDLVTEWYLTSDSKCEDLIKSWRWLDQSSGSQNWLMFFQDLPPDILIYKADRHEKYVFLSSPGESDKPDVRNGFVLSLDNLWCPFQDKAPSSPWETAKGNRTSSWWALYQLKPELGALSFESSLFGNRGGPSILLMGLKTCFLYTYVSKHW